MTSYKFKAVQLRADLRRATHLLRPLKSMYRAFRQHHCGNIRACHMGEHSTRMELFVAKCSRSSLAPALPPDLAHPKDDDNDRRE
jgi:hypothetical protein